VISFSINKGEICPKNDVKEDGNGGILKGKRVYL